MKPVRRELDVNLGILRDREVRSYLHLNTRALKIDFNQLLRTKQLDQRHLAGQAILSGC